MEIQVNVTDVQCSLVVSGEVDLSSSPKLRKAMMDALKKKQPLEVDLRECTYMDSSGVATLVEALKISKKDNQSFVLVCPSDSVTKVLKLTRLDSLFDIRESD